MSGGGKSSQQQKIDNQTAQQELAIQQSAIRDYTNWVNLVTSGGGYLPGVKQAAVSNAIQSVPQNYNQASQQLLSNLGSRGAAGGGSQPGSGLLGQGLGQLYSAEANQRSNLLNDITLQGQNNIAAAKQGILGIAGLGTQGGTSALGSATTAAGNADQASSSLWGGILGGGLGVLGSYLGRSQHG